MVVVILCVGWQIDGEWLTNSTDEGIETLGLHSGREIGRQQAVEGNVSWKAEVDTKISCMGGTKFF
jgi:CobQ-like glutamine amidotransferase family enzyme